MAPQPKTIGGGPAKALAGDWVGALQGTIGDKNGMDGIIGTLNQYLNADFNDPNSTALMKLGAFQREKGVNDIRARYSLGGTGYGTPASSAEAEYTAMFDPSLVNAVGTQKSTIALNLAQLISQLAGKGIPQAETVLQPSGFGQAVTGLTSLAGAAAPFFGGSPLAVASPSGGSDSSWLKKLNIPSWGY